MTKQGYKHQVGEVMQRVKTMADYVKIDNKGISQLIKVRKNPDNVRDILKKYVIEDWVTHISESYDAVAIALGEEIINRNPNIEKQVSLMDLGVIPKGKVEEVKPKEKVVQVKGYKSTKGYQRTSPGRYKNKERIKLFINSRVSMDNKKLTKEYNEWATKSGYKLRTQSAITTLKSRVKRNKW